MRENTTGLIHKMKAILMINNTKLFSNLEATKLICFRDCPYKDQYNSVTEYHSLFLIGFLEGHRRLLVVKGKGIVLNDR